MSIKKVFDAMGKSRIRGSEDRNIDPNWLIFEKDGTVRHARPGELPLNLFENVGISEDDGDFEKLENPLSDFEHPWRKRKTRREAQT